MQLVASQAVATWVAGAVGRESDPFKLIHRFRLFAIRQRHGRFLPYDHDPRGSYLANKVLWMKREILPVFHKFSFFLSTSAIAWTCLKQK